MYWLLIILYAILIYLAIIITCIVIYSIFIVLMVVGIQVNKRIMYFFECFMEFLFHPMSCICEVCFACITKFPFCRRPPDTNPRIATMNATNNPLYRPPIKEIEMVVIINPGGLPLQIGQESV